MVWAVIQWWRGEFSRRAATRKAPLLGSALAPISLLSAALLLPLIADAQQHLASIAESSIDASTTHNHAAPKDNSHAKAMHSHLHFVDDESALTLVTDPQFSEVGSRLVQEVTRVHQHYEDLFGPVPSFAVTLRLLEEEDFFASTGAPRWTNALFYRGQILIPLSQKSASDFSSVSRSVRHEYTHAVIHALSVGKTPGWIDEGLAQLAEGRENPALRRALLNYLSDSRPVPFALMQGGFTKLDSSMVAPAYAQSLIASEALLETFGFSRLTEYFTFLRDGLSHSAAFERAFGMPEGIFEARLAKKLSAWVARHQHRRNGTNDQRLLQAEQRPNRIAPSWDSYDDAVRASN